jgi:hypothetical protein
VQQKAVPDKQHKDRHDPLDAPDVVWRRGTDNEKGWSFKPLIRVKPGTDLLEMLNRLRDGKPVSD